MTAQLIDGKALAKQLRAGLRVRADQLAAGGVRPQLAVVLVGDDPASTIYVRNKVKACGDCGVVSHVHRMPAESTEAEVLAVVDQLNRDAAINGILVQLPLPRHIEVRKVIESIDVDKDVDGFHLYNVGALTIGQTVFPPCTPYGIDMLLKASGFDVDGKNAVVVGASNIVGRPMAMTLLNQGATVSICHIRTRDLAQFTILADLLIVAAGTPGLITGPMVRRGAVVVDVGINRLPDGRIVGDVDFEGVRERAAWITPVPGGVGPMTITALIDNTIRAAELKARSPAL